MSIVPVGEVDVNRWSEELTNDEMSGKQKLSELGEFLSESFEK